MRWKLKYYLASFKNIQRGIPFPSRDWQRPSSSAILENAKSPFWGKTPTRGLSVQSRLNQANGAEENPKKIHNWIFITCNIPSSSSSFIEYPLLQIIEKQILQSRKPLSINSQTKEEYPQTCYNMTQLRKWKPRTTKAWFPKPTSQVIDLYKISIKPRASNLKSQKQKMFNSKKVPWTFWWKQKFKLRD